MNEIPTYAEAVAADLKRIENNPEPGQDITEAVAAALREEARDKRLQEKFDRLGTFGVGVNPMDLIAISLDTVVGLLIKQGVIDKSEFDDVRLTHLDELLDMTLAQLAKPKLHIAK